MQPESNTKYGNSRIVAAGTGCWRFPFRGHGGAPTSPDPEADHRARARASWRLITMDASSTSTSRVARAANAYRAPAAAALTRPGGSSAFAAAAVLGGNHRIVGVGAPSTCFAAAARPAHPAAFSAASADEGQGLMSRMYAVAMGSRQAAAGGAAGIIARTASAPLDRIKLLFQVQAMECL